MPCGCHILTSIWFYILLHRKALARLCAFLEKEEIMYSENNLWNNSGFKSFKRRIDEQLQLNGIDDSLVDDETLLPFYRMGESETYVLSALGCSVGV